MRFSVCITVDTEELPALAAAAHELVGPNASPIEDERAEAASLSLRIEDDSDRAPHTVARALYAACRNRAGLDRKAPEVMFITPAWPLAQPDSTTAACETTGELPHQRVPIRTSRRGGPGVREPHQAGGPRPAVGASSRNPRNC